MGEKLKIFRSAVGSLPSWGLIEMLQEAGVEVVGLDVDPSAFGFYLLEKSYLVPRGSDPAFIPTVLELIDKEKPQAILSGPEEELLPLSRHRCQIHARGAMVVVPDYEAVVVCADKKKTAQMFAQINIPAPEVFSDLECVTFPCIVKPRFGRGSSGVHCVSTKEEVLEYVHKGGDIILQEFVEGEEYTVDVLSDKEGIVLSAVPRLRLKTESGISIQGKTVYDEEIIGYCKSISRQLKLFGPSCIQCIKRGDQVYFLEVNTRFGGGAILSVKADQTIIPNLLRLIRGQPPVPSQGFQVGLEMRRYYSEVFSQRKET